MRACGRRGRDWVMLAAIGMPKASVLPEPVGALPQMSRPANAAGMVAVWMGSGLVMPNFCRRALISAETPRSVKEVMTKLQSSDERPTRMKFRTGPAERWFNGGLHDSRERAPAKGSPEERVISLWWADPHPESRPLSCGDGARDRRVTTERHHRRQSRRSHRGRMRILQKRNDGQHQLST